SVARHQRASPPRRSSDLAVRRAEVRDLPVAVGAAPQLGVPTRDVGVVENAIALPGTAERSHGPVEHVAAVVERDDRAGLLETRGPVGGAALLLLRRHRVDHRVALLPLRRGLALARRRLHEPGLDAELAEAQTLVDLDAHLRAREQRVIVLARVLE